MRGPVPAFPVHVRAATARALTTLALLPLAAAILLAGPGPARAQKSILFEEFSSEIEVRPDGDILVTETMRPRFTGSWNGVERRLELRPPGAYRADYLFEVRVLGAEDEAGRTLRVEDSRVGSDTRRIRVWVPDATDRTATVVLRYQVGNALGFFEPDSITGLTLDELYWQVTGTDWDVPILDARARVILPQGAQPVQAAAYVGGPDSEQQVDVAMEEGAVTVPSVGRLDPGEGLTVAVGWEAGLVPRPSSGTVSAAGLQSDGGGRVGVGRSASPAGPMTVFMLWPLLLPFGVFFLAYRAWHRRGRDPTKRAVTVHWEPPPDLSPAEAGTLVDHRVEMHDIVSTLVDLAVRGIIVIEERKKAGFLSMGKDYAFHLMKPSPEWADLSEHEHKFLTGLFTTTTRRETLLSQARPDGFLRTMVEAFTGEPAAETAPEGAVDSVLLSDLKNEFYKKVPGIRDAIYRSLVRKGHYLRRPDKVRARWMVFALVCGGISFAGFFVITAGTTGGVVSGAALLIAGVSSAVIVAVFAYLMPARTEQGARTTEATLGFKQFLERVESPRYRRMITSPEQFEAYLPFAMAFRCEEKWAKAFEDMLTEPPDWYVGRPGAGFHASSFASDLHTLSTAAGSTLSSSPSSSGSGGGGSVGGGGGGGGGGGF